MVIVDSKLLSQALNRILENYRGNTITRPNAGMCYHVVVELEFLTGVPISRLEESKVVDRLQGIWHRWPLFSGYSEYPIRTLKREWEGYSRVKNKWIGKQGKLRESLILFLLEELKEDEDV